MIYVIKGNLQLDEKPVYLLMNNGDEITVIERDEYNSDFFIKFENTDEYYEWGKEYINDFGKIPLDSEDLNGVNGAFYRRTDQIDENGNFYLEHADQVTLSNGILMTKDNYTQYDGSEGWHWYEDGEIVSIATPSTWEKIKNFFNIG